MTAEDGGPSRPGKRRSRRWQEKEDDQVGPAKEVAQVEMAATARAI